MKKDSKRHGVVITEHSSVPWNTKTIYNRGHVMRVYRRVPKNIHFESPMVNDFNQHLCGGWGMPEIGNDNEAIADQLINKRKPFGSMTFLKEADARAMKKRLDASGLITVIIKRNDAWWGDVEAAQPITLGEIGNIDLLYKDYKESGVVDLMESGGYIVDGKLVPDDPHFYDQMVEYAARPLHSFFRRWDTPHQPTWVTGLILGYPIENTISIYLQ